MKDVSVRILFCRSSPHQIGGRTAHRLPAWARSEHSAWLARQCLPVAGHMPEEDRAKATSPSNPTPPACCFAGRTANISGQPGSTLHWRTGRPAPTGEQIRLSITRTTSAAGRPICRGGSGSDGAPSHHRPTLRGGGLRSRTRAGVPDRRFSPR